MTSDTVVLSSTPPQSPKLSAIFAEDEARRTPPGPRVEQSRPATAEQVGSTRGVGAVAKPKDWAQRGRGGGCCEVTSAIHTMALMWACTAP